jgi:hypothetical protein
MADKFDPAMPDPHPEKSVRGDKSGKKTDDELDKGLKESFPASDPVEGTEPAKSIKDKNA